MQTVRKAEESRASYLMEQWPDIGFLGMGAWWGWIWLRYNGVNSLYDFPNDNALSVFYSYMFSTLAIAAVVLLAAVFWRRFTNLVDNKLAVALFGLVAGVATCASGLFTAAGSPVLHGNAAVFTGVGTAFICLRTGRVYGNVPLGEALTNGALSLLLAAALYFIGEGIPQEWRLIYVSLLPLVSAGLFSLVSNEVFPAADGASGVLRKATSREHSMIRRLVLAASLVAFTAGVGKGITSLTISVEQFEHEGAVSVFFIGVAAAVVIALISRGSVYQGTRYAYSTLMVLGIALMLASCFGMSVSYLSIGKETLWFMFSCLMAYMAFRFEASSVRVFGIGQACYFVCSAAGWLVGAMLAPHYGDAGVRMICGVVLAFLVVLVMVYVFPEKSIKQIATWLPGGDADCPLQGQAARAGFAHDALPARVDAGKGAAFGMVEAAAGGEAASSGGGCKEDDLGHGGVIDHAGGIGHARTGEDSVPMHDGATQGDIAQRAADARYGLSQRELEVLRLFAQGRSANWIADSLIISKNTVRAHLRAIYTKLDVHSRQELLDFLNGENA